MDLVSEINVYIIIIIIQGILLLTMSWLLVSVIKFAKKRLEIFNFKFNL